MTPRYEGNPTHKKRKSQWGAPAHRSTKSICPPDIDDSNVVSVLEDAIPQAIARGHCSGGNATGHPTIVWGRSIFRRQDGTSCEVVWEARVTNPDVPTFHAYPITRDRHDDKMNSTVRDYLWP